MELKNAFKITAIFLLALSSMLFASDDALTPGRALMRQGAFQEALSFFESCQVNETEQGALSLCVAKCHFHMRDYKASRKHCRLAVEQNPEQALHHYWLGRSCFELAQRSSILKKMSIGKEFQRAMKQALTLEPEHASSHLLYIYFLLAMNKQDEASGHVDALRSLEAPEYPLAQAMMLRRQKLYREAELAFLTFCEQGAAVFGAESDGLAAQLLEREQNALGYDFIRSHSNEEAIACLKRNTVLFSDSFNAWDSLAEVYYLDQEKEGAVAAYAKAVALNPGRSKAQRKMAEAGQKRLAELQSQ